MRIGFRLLVLFLVFPLFTHCGSNSAPSTNIVTGPFDSRGYYVEDWVDKPEKWHRPPQPSKKSAPKQAVAKKQAPQKQATPPKRDPQPTQVAAAPTQPKAAPKPAPRPAPKPAPKPKPKPKPKPAPVVVRHKVVRGDNLSKLANRYGSTVSKIQKANGLSGSVIRIGQTLKIPK